MAFCLISVTSVAVVFARNYFDWKNTNNTTNRTSPTESVLDNQDNTDNNTEQNDQADTSNIISNAFAGTKKSRANKEIINYIIPQEILNSGTTSNDGDLAQSNPEPEPDPYPALPDTLTFYKSFSNTSNLTAGLAAGENSATFTADRSDEKPATFTNSNGKVKLANSANTPRFEKGYYDTNGFYALDGGGLLLEKPTTNVLLNSNFNDYSGNSGNPNGVPEGWEFPGYSTVTGTAGAAVTSSVVYLKNLLNTDPVFAVNAQRIQYTGVAGDTPAKSISPYTITAADSVPAGQSVTISFWSKIGIESGVNHFIKMYWRNAAGGFVGETNSPDFVPTTEWKRYQFTFTPPANTSLVRARFETGGIIAGDIVDFYLAAPQLELGKTATSYVPTTVSATATRSQDILSYEFAENATINQGTILLRYRPISLPNTQVTENSIIAQMKTDNDNEIKIHYGTNAENTINATFVSNGVSQTLPLDASSWTRYDERTLILTYSREAVEDGIKIRFCDSAVTDETCATATEYEAMAAEPEKIDLLPAGNDDQSIILEDVMVYSNVLTDGELVDLLTYNTVESTATAYNEEEEEVLVALGLFTDTHYDAMNANESSDVTDTYLQTAVDRWNLEDVNLIFGLGDNTDAYPTGPYCAENCVQNAIQDIATIDGILNSASAPSYLVTGSHDLQVVNFADYSSHLAGFNNSKGYHSFDSNGVHFIVMDTQDGGAAARIIGGIDADDTVIPYNSLGGVRDTSFANDGEWVKIDNEYVYCSGDTGTSLTGCLRGQTGSTATTHAGLTWINSVFEVSDEQLDWLDNDLLVNRSKPKIVLSHASFSLDFSNSVFAAGNAPKVRQRLENDGNVKLVLNGHTHGWMQNKINGILYYGLKAMVDDSTAHVTLKFYSDFSVKMTPGTGIPRY